MGTMQDYQMELRGYKSFNDMWQAVLGYNGDKKTQEVKLSQQQIIHDTLH